MSIYAICRDKIEDGYPCDDKHLSYELMKDKVSLDNPKDFEMKPTKKVFGLTNNKITSSFSTADIEKAMEMDADNSDYFVIITDKDLKFIKKELEE